MHSKYLCFRFTFNATTGKAEMHYKRFSDLPWEPKHEGLHVLAVIVYKLELVCMHNH